MKQWKEDEEKVLKAEFSELKSKGEKKARLKAKEEIRMIKEKLNAELEAKKQQFIKEQQDGSDVSKKKSISRQILSSSYFY